MTNAVQSHICPDIPGYLAVAFSFAARFLQLHDVSTSQTLRPVYLTAASFVIDRTVPSPELSLRIQYRKTDMPIQFLLDSQDLILPVVREDWTKRPALLRKPPVGNMLDALDLILSGAVVPAQRLAYVKEWLAPVFVQFPDLEVNLTRVFNERTLTPA